MNHVKHDEPPTKALQNAALFRDPGASTRDQRFDNIVRDTTFLCITLLFQRSANSFFVLRSYRNTW